MTIDLRGPQTDRPEGSAGQLSVTFSNQRTLICVREGIQDSSVPIETNGRVGFGFFLDDESRRAFGVVHPRAEAQAS